MTNVGQVYPRSLDLDTVSALEQLASSAVNMTTTVRLMAGQGLMSSAVRVTNH